MLPIYIDLNIYLLKNFNIFIFFIIFLLLIYLLNSKIKNKKLGFINIIISLILGFIITKFISSLNNLNLLFKFEFEKIKVPIHNYEGIYFFIAIFSAIIYFTYLCKQEGINLDIMYEAVFSGLLVALIFGRLFSFLFWNPAEFFKDPLVFFRPWEGGITVAGGVLAGLITGFIYAKIKKLHFFYHIQLFVPPILIGHIIGRFGCFLNGDAAGYPTKMAWGVLFNEKSVAYYNIHQRVPLHPTQLYEIFGNLILLLFILLTSDNQWITRRRIIWYAIGYSLLRFIIEFFRNDSVKWFWIFTTGQQICLIGLILGIGMLIWSLFNDDKLIPEEENIARVKKDK